MDYAVNRGRSLRITFGIIVSVIVLLTSVALASIGWDQSISSGHDFNDVAYSVQETSDRGYILAGSVGVKHGAVVWKDPFLAKYDSNGNLKWWETFGTVWNQEFKSVQQISDGSYVAAGKASSDLGLLMKIDAKGKKLWEEHPCGDVINSVKQTSDGGYILACDAFYYDYISNKYVDYAFLTKTFSNGKVDWSKTFGGVGSSVQETSDGGYIFAGYGNASSSHPNHDAWLIKTKTNGDVEWKRTFNPDIGSGIFRDVEQTPDGGYIAVGTAAHLKEEGKIWLVKTYANGYEQWNRTFGDGIEDAGYSVNRTFDGGYIIAGYNSSYFSWERNQTAWLIKTDSKGNIEWDERFSKYSVGTIPTPDAAYSVQQVSGGYIFAGISSYTWTQYPGDTNAWIVKIFKINYWIELADALDPRNIVVNNINNWLVDNEIFFSGVSSTKSGVTSSNEDSWIELKVIGPGNINFYWKVSSEKDYDFLEFYIDDVFQDRISGEVDWSQNAYDLSSGTHILKWRYAKDYSISRGEDSGWLDSVEFDPEYLGLLSGQVFAGRVGNENTPLNDVKVELYCSNNFDDPGTRIASVTTDSIGWYGIPVYDICEFYNLMETDLSDYSSVGATSVSGLVIRNNWIQYEYPLEGKTLEGNKFWDQRINQRPVADAYGPYNGAVGVGLAFDGSGSYDPDGTIVYYHWDFGDDRTGTGMYPEHTYAQDGIYDITLTVTDDDGATGVYSTTATIVRNLKPMASFILSPEHPLVKQVIIFDASASSDPDGTIVLYEWDFGDGNITNTSNPIMTHSYASIGDFDVNLSVKDNFNAINSTSKRIHISEDILYQTSIDIHSGWNLISVPFNLINWELGEEESIGNPLNVTPENSLTSIYRYNTTTALFEKSDHFDNWGWWPATGSENFTELEPGRGYWVMAQQDCELTLTGTAPSNLDVSLDSGWNLIGWYSDREALLGEEAAVENPLNVTPVNSLTSIYRYNTTSSLFEKSDHFDNWGWWPATGSESFTQLEPGRGYWVMAQDACEWKHNP